MKDEIAGLMAKKGLRFTNKLMKMFNGVDGRCRQLAISNPGRPMTDYCRKCQELFKKTLEGEFE